MTFLQTHIYPYETVLNTEKNSRHSLCNTFNTYLRLIRPLKFCFIAWYSNLFKCHNLSNCVVGFKIQHLAKGVKNQNSLSALYAGNRESTWWQPLWVNSPLWPFKIGNIILKIFPQKKRRFWVHICYILQHEL